MDRPDPNLEPAGETPAGGPELARPDSVCPESVHPEPSVDPDLPESATEAEHDVDTADGIDRYRPL